MKYDFDKIIDRQNTNSTKHDKELILKRFGVEGNCVSIWVADMDFACPPNVVEAIKTRAAHEIYGYSEPMKPFMDAVINWQKTRHTWEIESEWIKVFTGIVPAIAYAVNALTDVGDKIIIQQPVYHPFKSTVENNNRVAVNNALKLIDGEYYMDFEDLEEKARDAKMLILCSPHNPIGRIWSDDELRRLGQICNKNGVVVLSDEIHNDLIMPGNSYTTYASLGVEFADNSIVCSAASKTFNIAGLCCGYAIVKNPDIREKLSNEMQKIYVPCNTFGLVGTQAAYADENIPWLNEMIAYLDKNSQFIQEYINEHIPKVKYRKQQATYLAWLDCRHYEPNGEILEDKLLKSNLILDGGLMFGEAGAGFLRLNIACPKSVLKQAMDIIAKVLNS